MRCLTFVLWGIMLTCTGCHYRFGQGDIPAHYKTITIPYANGDEDGRLTNALVRKMSTSGNLEYCPNNGELILSVTILKLRDRNIGFRYDRSRRKEELLKTTIPTETRRTIFTEVAVIEACSDRVIVGPVRISSNVDFDHDYYSSPNAINIFSLGQLGNIDAAYDASLNPLYDRLAEKIADYVNNSW